MLYVPRETLLLHVPTTYAQLGYVNAHLQVTKHLPHTHCTDVVASVHNMHDFQYHVNNFFVFFLYGML